MNKTLSFPRFLALHVLALAWVIAVGTCGAAVYFAFERAKKRQAAYDRRAGKSEGPSARSPMQVGRPFRTARFDSVIPASFLGFAHCSPVSIRKERSCDPATPPEVKVNQYNAGSVVSSVQGLGLDGDGKRICGMPGCPVLRTSLEQREHPSRLDSVASKDESKGATHLRVPAILPSTERRTTYPPADIQTSSEKLSAVKLGTVPRWRKMWASAYAKGCECANPVRVNGKIVDCGKPKPPQPTRSGKWPEANWTIAAHPSDYPIGTVLQLSYRGILTSRIVHDIGSDITRGRLDLYMADCRRADTWGRKQIDVREVRRPLGAE